MNLSTIKVGLSDSDREALCNKKLWILDMDGTVYLGNHLFPETLPYLRHIRERGARYLFFTNNASRSKETYVKRLSGMGIPAGPEEIMTSGETLIRFLLHHRPGKEVYVLGTEDLRQEMLRAGIPLWTPARLKQDPFEPEMADPTEPGILVASFDTGLTYDKLDIACRLLRHGAEFLSTHPDYNCPVEGGFIPDSGAICSFLTASTGKTPRYFGKPYEDVILQIEEHTGLTRDQMVVVGDRLYTDIALGAANGMDSVLVLSGETQLTDLKNSPVQPRYIVQNVGEIFK